MIFFQRLQRHHAPWHPISIYKKYIWNTRFLHIAFLPLLPCLVLSFYTVYSFEVFTQHVGTSFFFSHFREKSHLIKNTNGGLRKTWFTHSKPCEFLFSLSVINSSLHLLFLSYISILFVCFSVPVVWCKPYAQYLFGYCATLNSILKDIVSLLNSSIQEYMARRSFLIHYCSLCFISLFMTPWPSLCRTSFDLFHSLWRHFYCEIVHRSS